MNRAAAAAKQIARLAEPATGRPVKISAVLLNCRLISAAWQMAMTNLSPIRAACAVTALAAALAACALQPEKRVAREEISVSTADAARAASLISAWRVSNGLSPVRLDTALNAPATEQAVAVAQYGKLTHGNFSARMERYGAPGAAAENLSAGSSDVADVINRWKRSSGHNRNMLLPDMRRIGLAKATSPGKGYGSYWALVLAN